jgi:CRP-like cAMP-binding protein
VKVYAPREVVLRQGEPGEAMFLIARGEVSVLVGRDGASTAEVARLKKGSLFGEMSLMTGEPRAASVQTLTETELVVVDKAAFAGVLADAPEVLTEMTRVLVARQAELESHLAARAAKAQDVELDERTSALLGRVRAFFKMT